MRALVAEPVLIILVLGTAGVLIGLWNRKAGLAVIALALALLYALSTPFLSSRLLVLAQAPDGALSPQRLEDADPGAIVVLSAGRIRSAEEYGGDTVDRVTLERLRYAAHVRRLTGLPVLVSGGRFRAGDPTLAALMETVLEDDFDVPVRWREEQSRTTHENARFAARELEREGIGSIILVTSAFHMRRAMEAFENEGIEVLPAATNFAFIDRTESVRDFIPTARRLLDSAHALHELAGTIAYRAVYR